MTRDYSLPTGFLGVSSPTELVTSTSPGPRWAPPLLDDCTPIPLNPAAFTGFVVMHTGGNAVFLLEDVCNRSGSVTRLSRPRPSTESRLAVRRSTRELLATVQSAFGLTVTGMAGILRVERPTIYAWLKEISVPSSTNAARLNKIAKIADHWLRVGNGQQYRELGRPLVHDASLNTLLRDEYLRTFVIEQALSQVAKAAAAATLSPKLSLRELARQRGIQNRSQGEVDILTGRRLGPEE